MNSIAAPALETARRPVVAAAVAVAATGFVAAGLTGWVVAESPVVRDPASTSVLRALLVAAYVAVGTYLWLSRPQSRLGLLVTGTGFLFALVTLDAYRGSLPYTLGRLALVATAVYLIYVFLCFPGDRLGSELERRLIVAIVVAQTLVWALALAVTKNLPKGGALTDCRNPCPTNAFQLVSAPGVARTAVFLVHALALVEVAVLLILLVGKYRSPARLRRRAIGPLLLSVGVLALAFASYSILRQAGIVAGEPFRIAVAASALAIPFALLVGQARGRAFAAASLVRLMQRMRGEPMTSALIQEFNRDALGDPTLTIALWAPERGRYVDVRGAAVELPTDSANRTVTRLTRSGTLVAAVSHDASLADGSGTVEGLVAGSLMLLENTRLVEEVRASRARIVASGQRERLRLERDLHDGAQPRLLSLQIKLEQARKRAGDQGLTALLDEIADDATAAVEDLRVLAHGIYPTALRERGLRDALRSVAASAAIPIGVVDRGIGRCSSTVEAAVYFCSLEAIQNAVKHAGSEARVTVTLRRLREDAEFIVADDGAGFDPDEESAGIGLVSMHDRIDAVGGTLQIISTLGQGTTVLGAVPAGDGAAPEATDGLA